MKIEKIPDSIDPLNLEQIRDECLNAYQKTAYCSAGAAIVPIFSMWWLIWHTHAIIPDINAFWPCT